MHLSQPDTPTDSVGWDWDARGNPTAVHPGLGGDISFSYATSPRVDELTTEMGPRVDSHLRTDYEHDLDGRVKRMNWPVDSSGQPAGFNIIGYDGNSSAIGDSAIRSVNTRGGLFQYVYDEKQRRRAKVYPWSGGQDTFSYSIITLPVCSAWLPLPTPKCTCGFGRPRSAKNASDMLAS